MDGDGIDGDSCSAKEQPGTSNHSSPNVIVDFAMTRHSSNSTNQNRSALIYTEVFLLLSFLTLKSSPSARNCTRISVSPSMYASAHAMS